MIELRNVTMNFGETCLLENVSLSVEKGESLVLIGPSGQGKSVILKLLAGILKPTSGEVFVDKKNLLTLRGKERQRLLRRMGMLFQKNALFDSLTVGENIGFPLRETTALNEDEIGEKITQFLKAVGLGHARDLFPDEISGGMQKRLGIARALALNPEIIFYDDPTAGLDPITSRIIVDLILNLKKEAGSTVVAITNDINRAYQIAGKIGMVFDRQIIQTGTAEETRRSMDARVRQFTHGHLLGPLTVQA